jgi:hypothetical protein
MNTLPQLIVGKLPPGWVRCVCGDRLPPPTGAALEWIGTQRKRTGLSFVFGNCMRCGHIMHWPPYRDLTRAEAAELAASPDFPRVRAVVGAAVKHLVG